MTQKTDTISKTIYPKAALLKVSSPQTPSGLGRNGRPAGKAQPTGSLPSPFLSALPALQSQCLPTANLDLAPSTPITFSQAAGPLPRHPSYLPVRSQSTFRAQLRCCHLCKTSLRRLLSPGRTRGPSFVIRDLFTGFFVTSQHSTLRPATLPFPPPHRCLTRRGTLTSGRLHERPTNVTPPPCHGPAEILQDSKVQPVCNKQAVFLLFLLDLMNTFLPYKKCIISVH